MPDILMYHIISQSVSLLPLPLPYILSAVTHLLLFHDPHSIVALIPKPNFPAHQYKTISLDPVRRDRHFGVGNPIKGKSHEGRQISFK